MTRQFINLLFILFLFNFSNSQDLSFLKKKNGFRDLKLGSRIEEYPQFHQRDSTTEPYFGIWKNYDYIIDLSYEEYTKIGDAKIRMILAKTIDGLIYELFIYVDYKPEVLDLLKSAYGRPNWINKSDNGLIWDRAWNIGDIQCRIFDDNVDKGVNHIDKPYRLYYVNSVLRKKAFRKEREDKRKRAIKEF